MCVYVGVTCVPLERRDDNLPKASYEKSDNVDYKLSALPNGHRTREEEEKKEEEEKEEEMSRGKTFPLSWLREALERQLETGVGT